MWNLVDGPWPKIFNKIKHTQTQTFCYHCHWNDLSLWLCGKCVWGIFRSPKRPDLEHASCKTIPICCVAQQTRRSYHKFCAEHTSTDKLGLSRQRRLCHLHFGCSYVLNALVVVFKREAVTTTVFQTIQCWISIVYSISPPCSSSLISNTLLNDGSDY